MPHDKFKRGDVVRVKEGFMAGHIGDVVSIYPQHQNPIPYGVRPRHGPQDVFCCESWQLELLESPPESKDVDAFWLVWLPEGRNPTARYLDEESARTEAARLATAHPGPRFFVLKVIASVVVPSPGPQWTLHAEETVPF